MRNLIVLIVFLFSVSKVIAQDVFKNHDFVNKFNNESKVFWLPYFLNNQKEMNNLFYETLVQDGFVMIDSEKVAHNILNHATFINSLQKTVGTTLDNPDLKDNYNIYYNLTNEELRDFKNNCLGADMIIIGGKIESTKIIKLNGSGNVSLKTNILVFDLTTGAFVLKISGRVKKKFDDISSYDNADEQLLVLKSLSHKLFDVLKIELYK